MTAPAGGGFAEVVAADFEFAAAAGGRPVPHCVVYRGLRSGTLGRVWLADDPPPSPPYPTGPDTLFVAYYASAELGCHLALGWPLPERVLDLYAEFRNLTNGLAVPAGDGLLGALTYFGLDALDAAEKAEMRQLAIRGGPFTDPERAALTDYCQSDVDALARLFPAMWPRVDLPRALLRGRYMAAVARMEWAGTPVDADTLARLRADWDRVKGGIVREVNKVCGAWVPANRRHLDPGTPFGAAVLVEARESGTDPHDLAEAALALWRQERADHAERSAALAVARRRTGVTARKAARWEDAGRDHTLWAGLDVAARDLAAERPDLGLGTGYDDDSDLAAALWDRLRLPTSPPPPKHDPGLIRRASSLVGSTDGDAGGPLRFSERHFGAYLARLGIAWPRLDSGHLALDDDTFREMSRAYPDAIGPVREARHAVGQMRLNDLAVGGDGRNRCLLSCFRSTTGRNQPSNSKFIFGPSAWLRSLIKPGPGRAVAYVDWSQQELAIAAALSGDPRMCEAYASGDFYLTFAKMAGAVPAGATKKSHAREREVYKVVSLGVLYGLTDVGIARRLGASPAAGRELLDAHRRTFRQFWRWSDAVEVEGLLGGRLRTAFGWTLHVGKGANPRSVRNFPMQAGGAEMMRLAACLATEAGLTVCCPVHDAFLIEASAEAIDADAAGMQAHMARASELVLPGFPLKTEASVVRYPDRYADPRGVRMWAVVTGLLNEGGGPPGMDHL